MALVNVDAIRTAVTERLTGAIRGGRAISPGYVSDDIHGGASDYTKAARAAVRPRFDVAIDTPRRSEQSPNYNANVWLYDVTLTVTSTYKLESPGLEAADYERVKSQAIGDVSRFVQALCDPGYLATTADGTSTGIVSGMLFFQSARTSRDDARAGLFETAIALGCTVKVSV